MTNQTPPAWITKAASRIVDLFELPYLSDQTKAENIISANAPDAEALAVACELSLALVRKFMPAPDIGLKSFSEWATAETILIDALDSYRARFPLAPVAVENAPAVELVAVAE